MMMAWMIGDGCVWYGWGGRGLSVAVSSATIADTDLRGE